jgi:hypothetical protein
MTLDAERIDLPGEVDVSNVLNWVLPSSARTERC